MSSKIISFKNVILRVNLWFHLRFSSVQFSHLVMSDSLRHDGPQHVRPPCPSPTLKVHPNSCPLSQWCHPNNSSSEVTICSDFGAPKIKSDTVSTVSPSICHEVMRLDAMILVFSMFDFKPTFSLSSFTFKRLFSSSSLSAIRVVSSAYLRLLIFLQAILIPACVSSSPAFLMMYSAYMLNKQGDNIQPWCTPFPIWNQSVVPCPVLTCFLTCIQISQEADQVVWYSHLFQNFP